MAIRRILAIGGLLAVFAGLLVDHGAHFGADVPQIAMLGLALGAVLGLVTSVSPLVRCVGFIAGFIASWLGFALRAAALPDIPAGRAIAAMLVVAAVTLVTAISRGRVPLAAGLLGAGAMAGAYETTFALNPTAFATDSVAAATTALLCAGIGFLAAELLSEALPVETPAPARLRSHLPLQRHPAHDSETTSTKSEV